MTDRLSRISLLSLLLTVLFIGQAPAFGQSGEQALDRLQEKYESISALEAEFTQTLESPYSSAPQQSSGRVVLKNQQYRVETGAQTLVTNGETTWIYSPGENQVLINDYKQDETTFSLNDFLFNHEDRYDVTQAETVTMNGERHVRIEMEPKKQNDFFRTLTFWMRDRDAVVTRLEVVDMNETSTTYTLDGITLNPSLDGETFSFQPPQGAEIVDLRS